MTFLWSIFLFLKRFDFWLYFFPVLELVPSTWDFLLWYCLSLLSVILAFIILSFFHVEKACINYIIVLITFDTLILGPGILDFGINESNPSRDFLDPKSKHKPENTCYGSSEESSGDEIPFKKRKERRRSNTSESFVETLPKAKSSSFSCTSNMVVSNRTIQIKLSTSTGTFYDVVISENPSCSWSYFSNPRKTKHVCIHIVWILLNKFGLKEQVCTGR